MIDDWRPIDSAPKGTMIMIYARPYMAVAFADPDNEFAWTMDDGHDFFRCTRRQLQNPTHWVPLPEPPK
jgi:hypothetical protein